MSDLATTIADAKAVLATAEAATPVVWGAALDVIEAGKGIATTQGVDIRSILTGDPFTDRALLETADVQAAIGRSVDWSAVPDVAFRVAGAVLSLVSLAA